MSVTDRYDAAVTEIQRQGNGDPALLPIVLASACLPVLRTAGAGMSMFTADGVRVPIGASDGTAATAERLQFTVGQGPCLSAHQEVSVQLADRAALERRWPMFHRQLLDRTPFRSIVAVPLAWPLERVGTLDLHYTEPELDGRFVLADVQAVGAQITSALLAAFTTVASGAAGGLPAEDGEPPTPPWLDDSHSPRRAVFIATGMLNVALEVNTSDALAVLRAHAFATDTTVDAVAHDLVTGALPVRDVQPASDR